MTEIINISTMLEKNKDKENKQVTKEMKVECPELNFYTDHVLNGTMLQVSQELYWFASADYFGRYNKTLNCWNFTKQITPAGKFFGASMAMWFDDGYD